MADVTVPEPWATAVDAVLRQFVAYSVARMESGDLEECRRAAGVGEVTGERFEIALNRICPDDEDDEDTEEDEAASAGTEAARIPEGTTS